MTEEEEKQFRREQIELLNLIVSKLILIESGQSTLERSIFYGITRTTNKMIQKMRNEIIRNIRSERETRQGQERPTPKKSLWRRAVNEVKFLLMMIRERFTR